MSICLHIGQGGLQVGATYWDFMNHHHTILSQSVSTFYSYSYNHLQFPRALFIDTEPKVLKKIQSSTVHALDDNIHIEHDGRGNNWAMGFYGHSRQKQQFHKGSNSSPEAILSSLRKEMERSDSMHGILLTHSLAGGTGAGLGSRIVQEIRETYPKVYLMSIVLSPSLTGETPLQNYNAILTLKHIQEHCDAIIYKSNDDLQKMMAYWHTVKKKRKDADVTLDEMNAILTVELAGLFLPQNGKPFRLGQFVNDMCPMPSLKFIDLHAASFSAPGRPTQRGTWPPVLAPVYADFTPEALCKHLVTSYGNVHSKRTPCLTSQTIIRGFTHDAKSHAHIEKTMARSFPIVPWNSNNESSCLRWDIDKKGKSNGISQMMSKGNDIAASVTLAMNHHVHPSVAEMARRAELQYQARAYTHWYTRHGLELSEFEHALDSCYTVLDDYEAAYR